MKPVTLVVALASVLLMHGASAQKAATPPSPEEVGRRLERSSEAEARARACVEAYAGSRATARATPDEIAEAAIAACDDQITAAYTIELSLGPDANLADIVKWLRRFAIKAVVDHRVGDQAAK
jgi:hypothetical protein